MTTVTNQPAVPATTSILTTIFAMPTVSGSPDDNNLAPKYIGAIVAGVVGFILVIALAVWIIRRQLNKVMHVVDQRLENAPPVSDKGDGAQPGPGRHELHGNPTSTEIWDGPNHGKPNPNHRWEMGGSYDAHGTSELDTNENAAKGDQAPAQPEKGSGRK